MTDQQQTRRNKVEAQTWRNVPPFEAVTLWKARCPCGWAGLWWRYRENAEAETHKCNA